MTSENYWQYCIYFLIWYENWGWNLDYYRYFDIEDTSGLDEHKKDMYRSTYDVLIRDIAHRQILKKDMVYRELKKIVQVG